MRLILCHLPHHLPCVWKNLRTFITQDTGISAVKLSAWCYHAWLGESYRDITVNAKLVTCVLLQTRSGHDCAFYFFRQPEVTGALIIHRSVTEFRMDDRIGKLAVGKFIAITNDHKFYIVKNGFSSGYLHEK